MPVDRERGTGERGRTERTLVEAGAGIADAAAVSAEHLDIGEQVMAEGDRLRRLQMGEARHHRAGVSFGLFGHGELEIGHLAVDLVERVAHPQPHVGRDLVVARAGGVQAAGGEADLVLEVGLDVHVDVFERPREREGPALDLALDLFQAGDDRRDIFLRQDAGLGQHGRMRQRAADILAPELLVEIDGGIDLLHDGVGTCGETPTPHAIAHDGLSCF